MKNVALMAPAVAFALLLGGCASGQSSDAVSPGTSSESTESSSHSDGISAVATVCETSDTAAAGFLSEWSETGDPITAWKTVHPIITTVEDDAFALPASSKVRESFVMFLTWSILDYSEATSTFSSNAIAEMVVYCEAEGSSMSATQAIIDAN